MTPGPGDTGRWEASRAKVQGDLVRFQDWLEGLDKRLRAVEQRIDRILGVYAAIGKVVALSAAIGATIASVAVVLVQVLK